MESIVDKPSVRNMRFALAELTIHSLYENDFRFEKFLKESEGFGYKGWVIGNLETVPHEGRSFIFGRLGKVHKGVTVPRFDESKKKFVKVSLPEEAAYYVNFVVLAVDKARFLFAIQETTNIPLKKFISIFEKIVSERSPKEVGELEFLPIEKDVKETLSSLAKLERARFSHLRPSNPETYSEYEDLDRLLKESSTKDASVKVEGGDEGLDPKGGIVKEATAMAEAGYANATYFGIYQLRRVVLDLRDKLIRYVVKTKDEGSFIVQELAELLFGKRNDRKRNK